MQALLYPTPAPLKDPLKSSLSAVKSAKFNATPIKSTLATREKETARDLAALRAALAPLLSAPHTNVALLARVVELRALIALGRWAEVSAALENAEAAVGVVFPASEPASAADPPLYTTSPFHAALVVHVLVLGVVWFAYSAAPPSPASGAENGVGASTGTAAVSARLTMLYTLLDAGVYNGKCRTVAADVQTVLESEGVLEVR